MNGALQAVSGYIGDEKRSRAAFLLLSLFVVFTASVLGNLEPVWDPDSYWHLAVSKEMVESGRLVKTSLFTFEDPGREWADVDWLAHLLYYPVFEAGGYRGLEWFTALIAGVIAIISFFTARTAGAGRASFILYLGLFFPAFAGRIRLRPETLSLLLFAALLLLLFAWRKGLVGKGPLLTMVTALFLVWVQVHPAWAYGFVVIFIFGLSRFLEAEKGSASAAIYPASLIAAPAAALFLNPFGYELPLFPFRSLMGFVSKDATKIAEWQSSPWEKTTIPFLAAALLVCLYYLWKSLKEKKISLEFMLSLSQFVLLALWVRYCSFAFLALAPLCPQIFDAISKKWKFSKLAFYILILVLLISPVLRGTSYSTTEESQLLNYPVRECDFFLANSLSGNLLHNFVSGGYLEFRLYPSGKSFLDGRYYPFIEELNELKAANRSPSAFKEFMSRHDFEAAILPYFIENKKENLLSPSMVRHVFPEDSWSPVFYGPHGMVVLKKIPRFSAVIEKQGYGLLYPSEVPFLKNQVKTGSIEREKLLKEVRRAESDGAPTDKW